MFSPIKIELVFPNSSPIDHGHSCEHKGDKVRGLGSVGPPGSRGVRRRSHPKSEVRSRDSGLLTMPQYVSWIEEAKYSVK